MEHWPTYIGMWRITPAGSFLKVTAREKSLNAPAKAKTPISTLFSVWQKQTTRLASVPDIQPSQGTRIFGLICSAGAQATAQEQANIHRRCDDIGLRAWRIIIAQPAFETKESTASGRNDYSTNHIATLTHSRKLHRAAISLHSRHIHPIG